MLHKIQTDLVVLVVEELMVAVEAQDLEILDTLVEQM